MASKCKSALNLTQLLELPENWDSYSSPKIGRESVKKARQCLLAFFWLGKPLIAPKSGGGVLLQWTGMGWDFDIDIYQDGRIESFYIGRV